MEKRCTEANEQSSTSRMARDPNWRQVDESGTPVSYYSHARICSGRSVTRQDYLAPEYRSASAGSVMNFRWPATLGFEK